MSLTERKLAVAAALIGLSAADRIAVLESVLETARCSAAPVRTVRGSAVPKMDRPFACGGCGGSVTRHRPRCPRDDKAAPIPKDEHGRLVDNVTPR